MGHRHDLERVPERGRADLDDLADRQHLVVGAVEDVAGGVLVAVDAAQHGVGEVLGVAVVVEGEAVVGHHDAGAAVEDAPHDAPLAGHDLQRPVGVRVAEVGGPGVVAEDDLLGAGDPVALLVLLGLGHERGRLVDRHREALGVEQERVHPAPDGGHPADRHEAVGHPDGELGDAAQPAVHGDDQVVAVPVEGGGQRVDVVGVGVEVGHLVGGLGPLVGAPVQDRDVPPPVDEALHDVDPGRTGAPDDQRGAHDGSPPKVAHDVSETDTR